MSCICSYWLGMCSTWHQEAGRVMFSLLIWWLLSVPSNDVETWPSKTAVCFEYGDNGPLQSAICTKLTDRSWQEVETRMKYKSNMSGVLGGTHSLLYAKEMALAPWQQLSSLKVHAEMQHSSQIPAWPEIHRTFESFGYWLNQKVTITNSQQNI